MNPEEQNVALQALFMFLLFLGPGLALWWIDRKRQAKGAYDRIHQLCHPTHKRWRDW